MRFELPTVDLEMFTSTEASRISGMPQDMLRLWRSRGHLPAKTGRGAVYTALEIAEIMVRYDLSLNGIAPAKSAEIGSRGAQSIMWIALINHPICCEIIGNEVQIESLQELHRETDLVVKSLFPLGGKGDLLFRRDSMEPEILADLQTPIDERSFKSAMILNFQTYARVLVNEAGQPLLCLSYGVGEGDEFVRAYLGGN